MQSHFEAFEALHYAPSIKMRGPGTLQVRLFASLALAATLFLVAVAIGADQSEFSYHGYLTNSNACDLKFKIDGTAVTGTMKAAPICEYQGYGGVFLPGIDMVFQGTVSGGTWEGADTIIAGTWTAVDPGGADIFCSDTLTGARNVGGPKAGAFIIYMEDSTVIFVRNGKKNAEFKAARQIYTPTAAPVGAGPEGAGPGAVEGPIVEWPISVGGNGHYYEAVLAPEGATWLDGAFAADAKGWYLATITSEAENEFVYNLVADDDRFWFLDAYNNELGPYLGGSQERDSSEPAIGWRWPTGELFSYTNWATGQPDWAAGQPHWPTNPGEPGLCYGLEFIGIGNLRSSKWNDIPISWTDGPGYIIEWDAEWDAREKGRIGPETEPPETEQTKKGRITSGAIKAKAVMRGTGAPVPDAIIEALVRVDDTNNILESYDICWPQRLKTANDGTFELNIATDLSNGPTPVVGIPAGRYYLQIRKPLPADAPEQRRTDIAPVEFDLWPIKDQIFTITPEMAKAGPINPGIIEMDQVQNIFG